MMVVHSWPGYPPPTKGLWFYPGYTFKHAKAGWGNRLQVTGHSLNMCLEHMLGEWLTYPEGNRRKFSKKDVEEFSELSALVEAIFNEALRSTPLKNETLEDSICLAFKRSDHHLLLELSGILSEKPEKLNIEAVSMLKALLVQHTKSNMQSPSTLTMMVDLEGDTFKLMEASVKHDIKAVQIYLNKVSTYESGQYWMKLEWEQTAAATIRDGVKAFMGRYTRITHGEGRDILARFLEYKREVVSKPHHKIGMENLVGISAFGSALGSRPTLMLTLL